MLSRFGVCRIPDFGGCGFSSRPIDMHIEACVAFGGRISGDCIVADKLRGATVRFRRQSVGATINAIILAATADGDSRIYGYAKEPHVLALIDFLISAGADISLDNEKISVRGRPLHGADVTVIGDMIEAGTYLAAGIATNGRVGVSGCREEELSAFITAIGNMGAEVSVLDGVIWAQRGEKNGYASVICEAYPGFPTDLQPIAAALMANLGGGEILDNVWPERYGYLDSLAPLGLKYSRAERGAKIYSSHLLGARVTSADLRGGAAAVICALAARGRSVVEKAEYILRGYENVEEKFSSLGAEIRLIL